MQKHPDFIGVPATLPGSMRLYRTWYVNMAKDDGLCLGSIGWYHRWETPTQKASCKYTCMVAGCKEHVKQHEAPLAGCSCGIYGYYSPDNEYFARASSVVVGTIRAYGRVILGTKGARVEYAEVESLILLNSVVTSLENTLFQRYPDATWIPSGKFWRDELTNRFPPEDLSAVFEAGDLKS